jgi:demethylmenaquinone methyltransferase/2-methoxy-6-polyprenyl-1,4-benzoquinol methylase
MLKEAQKRLSNEQAFIRYIRANATSLPIPDNTYDTIMISYGMRNICDRERAILEMARVLKPKGKLFVLELTRPNALISPILRIYLQTCIPIIGGLLTRQWRGYRHLAKSIYSFSTSQLIEQLHQSGFACNEIFSNSCGILTFIHAEKL